MTNTPLWTAIQANRAGFVKGGGLAMTDIGDSLDIAFHCDTMFGIAKDENANDRIHWGVLKTRNGVGVGKNLTFAVNNARMRLYDVSKAEGVAYQALQDNLKQTKTKRRTGRLRDVQLRRVGRPHSHVLATTARKEACHLLTGS